MQARRSLEPHRASMHSNYRRDDDREGLIHAYDEEAAVGLADLEGSDASTEVPSRNSNGHINGHARRGSEPTGKSPGSGLER